MKRKRGTNLRYILYRKWWNFNLLISLNSDTHTRTQYLIHAWLGQSAVWFQYYTYINAVDVYITYFSCDITWLVPIYPVKSTKFSMRLFKVRLSSEQFSFKCFYTLCSKNIFKLCLFKIQRKLIDMGNLLKIFRVIFKSVKVPF